MAWHARAPRDARAGRGRTGRRAGYSCGRLDELFALLRAVKAGEVSEVEALPRVWRSPRWVWGARDPVTQRLLTIDVGDHTLAMTQRVVHQAFQVLAPGCVPLVLTEGSRRT